jgi:hypothetical protein
MTAMCTASFIAGSARQVVRGYRNQQLEKRTKKGKKRKEKKRERSRKRKKHSPPW